MLSLIMFGDKSADLNGSIVWGSPSNTFQVTLSTSDFAAGLITVTAALPVVPDEVDLLPEAQPVRTTATSTPTAIPASRGLVRVRFIFLSWKGIGQTWVLGVHPARGTLSRSSCVYGCCGW